MMTNARFRSRRGKVFLAVLLAVAVGYPLLKVQLDPRHLTVLDRVLASSAPVLLAIAYFYDYPFQWKFRDLLVLGGMVGYCVLMVGTFFG